jgi:hypothetical protein
MSTLLGSNLVAPRPKEKARYTIRELLTLGLTLPIRFCPLDKFGPEALGLEIVSMERMQESLFQFEREQIRRFSTGQHIARKRSYDAVKARVKAASV